PPAVSIPRHRAQRLARTGRLRVRLRCSEQCTVTATGRVSFGATRLALRRARATLAAGAVVPVDLKLAASKRRSVARALRARRVVRARVSLRAVDAAGNAVRRAVTVRIRR
ncbi:MAG TPA: hypothetical protein VFZ89_06985, partial [Solirubrobacteraceae bacterium]